MTLCCHTHSLISRSTQTFYNEKKVEDKKWLKRIYFWLRNKNILKFKIVWFKNRQENVDWTKGKRKNNVWINEWMTLWDEVNKFENK